MYIIKTIIDLLLRWWQGIYSEMFKIYETYFLESELIYHENVETFIKKHTRIELFIL